MTLKMNFPTEAKAILRRHGFKQRTPDELIEWWANLVEQCVDGYDWTIYEFDYELVVRDYIEALMNEPSLANSRQFEEFKQRVAELDRRFKAVLQEGVQRPWKSQSWWRVGVLKYAGEDYREDMSSRYAIDVEISGTP